MLVVACSRANFLNYLSYSLAPNLNSETLVDWLALWIDGWLEASCLAGLLVVWLDRWMDGWMTDWLAGWIDGWIDGWLVGWFIGTSHLQQCMFFFYSASKTINSSKTTSHLFICRLLFLFLFDLFSLSLSMQKKYRNITK